jgi:hypothetical protein
MIGRSTMNERLHDMTPNRMYHQRKQLNKEQNKHLSLI